jgi:hypothetical protein
MIKVLTEIEPHLPSLDLLQTARNAIQTLDFETVQIQIAVHVSSTAKHLKADHLLDTPPR